METRAGSCPGSRLVSLGIWVLIAAHTLPTARAEISCVSCPLPVQLNREEMQLGARDLRSIRLEFRELGITDQDLGTDREHSEGVSREDALQFHRSLDEVPLGDTPEDSALRRAKRSEFDDLSNGGWTGAAGVDAGAPEDRGSNGQRSGRSEYRWNKDDGRGNNRQDEPKLSSSTFSLTGDSAHNHAVVYWSGRNSSGSDIACQECDSSCLECRGPGPSNCTVCPAQAILEAGGRCLLCCHPEEDEDFATPQQDCCNCTETRGQCILSTNLPFRNEEEEEARGNLTIFIIASVLLVLGLVVVFFLIKHSRSKGAQSDLPPRGYTKLGSAGGFGSSSKYGGYTSSSSASYSGYTSSAGGRFQEAELVDISGRRSVTKEDDDDDDDDDEDIVYMGQDGTVYRKFRYGQLGEDEDELEYDDESYRFR